MFEVRPTPADLRAIERKAAERTRRHLEAGSNQPRDELLVKHRLGLLGEVATGVYLDSLGFYVKSIAEAWRTGAPCDLGDLEVRLAEAARASLWFEVKTRSDNQWARSQRRLLDRVTEAHLYVWCTAPSQGEGAVRVRGWNTEPETELFRALPEMRSIDDLAGWLRQRLSG